MYFPPNELYKQFHTGKYTPVENMQGLQWFALVPNYGDESSYGNDHRKYKLKEIPKLLDLGNANVRKRIEKRIARENPLHLHFLNPNDQYAGGASNAKYHSIVQQYFGQEYDGTMLDSELIIENDTYKEVDLAGASEVVLWGRHNDLLEEVPRNEYLAPTNIIENIKKRKKGE